MTTNLGTEDNTSLPAHGGTARKSCFSSDSLTGRELRTVFPVHSGGGEIYGLSCDWRTEVPHFLAACEPGAGVSSQRPPRALAVWTLSRESKVKSFPQVHLSHGFKISYVGKSLVPLKGSCDRAH